MYQFLIDEKRIREDTANGQESFADIQNITEETKHCITLLLINKWSEPIIGICEYSRDSLNPKRRSFIFAKAISTHNEKYEKLGFKYTPPKVIVELSDKKRVELFSYYKDIGSISLDIRQELSKNPIGVINEGESYLSNYAIYVYYDNIELKEAMDEISEARKSYLEYKQYLKQQEIQKRIDEEKLYKEQQERQALSDSLGKSVYHMFRSM